MGPQEQGEACKSKEEKGKERSKRGDGRFPAAGRTIAAPPSVADKQIAN